MLILGAEVCILWVRFTVLAGFVEDAICFEVSNVLDIGECRLCLEGAVFESTIVGGAGIDF